MDDATALKMSVVTLARVVNNNAEASIKANKKLAKLVSRTRSQGVILAFAVIWLHILTVQLTEEMQEVETLKTEVEKLKKKGE